MAKQNVHETLEELWEAVFPTRSMPHVEAGSNTSTVALRVVGGDRKGSLESGTVKYGRESHRTRIREWMHWRGPVAIVNGRPILSSERMLYKDYNRSCSFEKKILAVSLKGLGA
jgi:hypothetical protein